MQTPDEEKACPLLNLDLDDLPIERTLGFKWIIETVGFRFSSSTRDATPTKRGMLVMRRQTLGVLAPLLVTARNVIGRSHLMKVTPSAGTCGSVTWSVSPTSRFLAVSVLKFGFGVWRVSYASEWKNPREFIISRNRMAPLRKLSISLLELHAAVLSTRLADSVKEEMTLNIVRTTFWSDAKFVLQYIQNESGRFHSFVANRVSKIQDSSEPSQWRHVPGHLIPADDWIRGLRASELAAESRWINGPTFL